jgi:hypothetical protein
LPQGDWTGSTRVAETGFNQETLAPGLIRADPADPALDLNGRDGG